MQFQMLIANECLPGASLNQCGFGRNGREAYHYIEQKKYITAEREIYV